jgi:hypothetical protein
MTPTESQLHQSGEGYLRGMRVMSIAEFTDLTRISIPMLLQHSSLDHGLVGRLKSVLLERRINDLAGSFWRWLACLRLY